MDDRTKHEKCRERKTGGVWPALIKVENTHMRSHTHYTKHILVHSQKRSTITYQKLELEVQYILVKLHIWECSNWSVAYPSCSINCCLATALKGNMWRGEGGGEEEEKWKWMHTDGRCRWLGNSKSAAACLATDGTQRCREEIKHRSKHGHPISTEPAQPGTHKPQVQFTSWSVNKRCTSEDVFLVIYCTTRRWWEEIVSNPGPATS